LRVLIKKGLIQWIKNKVIINKIILNLLETLHLKNHKTRIIMNRILLRNNHAVLLVCLIVLLKIVKVKIPGTT
jgi:hypothetical protein